MEDKCPRCGWEPKEPDPDDPISLGNIMSWCIAFFIPFMLVGHFNEWDNRIPAMAGLAGAIIGLVYESFRLKKRHKETKP